MPRLGSFLVCEKIIDDKSGKPSLILIFQKVGALLPQGQVIPKDTLAATPWAVFSEWFFTSEEITKKFDQVLEVALPDGTPSPIRGRLTIAEISKDGQGSRCYVNMTGMPIAQVGFVRVNLWLECNSERVSDVSSYLIKIEHLSEPPTPSDGGSIAATMVSKTN